MSTTVWAYIDPGTGSIILQVVIGGLLGVSFFLRSKVKQWFRWTKGGANGRKASADVLPSKSNAS